MLLLYTLPGGNSSSLGRKRPRRETILCCLKQIVYYSAPGWSPRTPPFQFPRKQRAECTDRDNRSQKQRRLLKILGRACVPPTSLTWRRCSRPRPCVFVETIEFNLAVFEFSAPGSDEKMELSTDYAFIRIPWHFLPQIFTKSYPQIWTGLVTKRFGAQEHYTVKNVSEWPLRQIS